MKGGKHTGRSADQHTGESTGSETEYRQAGRQAINSEQTARVRQEI